MGAAPGHKTSASLAPPAALPLPQPPKSAEVPLPVAKKAPAKPYQVGRASWYGGFFQGKSTASGEDYDMYDFTAAHRELPLGTFVRVTNLKNLKSVLVRVNDRGPVTPGRIIDLSYNAARALGMHQQGLERVRIDLVDQQQAELAFAQQPATRH